MMPLFSLGLIFGLLSCASFYAFGSAITNMFKINIKNNFANLAIGAFLYFSLIFMFFMPILLLKNIPYFILIYYFLILNIAYLLTVLVFIKFWFQSIKISWETFTLAILFLLTILFFYLTKEIKLSNNVNKEFHNIINAFRKKDDKIINFFILAKTKHNVKNFPIWYIFLMLPFYFERIVPINNESFNLINYLEGFSLIFNACILFSIFAIVYPLLKINSYKWFNLLSLVVFWVVAMLFFVFVLDIKHPQFVNNNLMKYYLVFLVTLFIAYVNENYRMKSMPLLIGMVLPAYIVFNWNITFQFLFLFYTMLFIIQIRYFNIFVKDFTKMALFIFSSALFYCFKQELYFQVIAVTILIVITFIFIVWINTNYHKINLFEVYVNRNISFFILIAPFILIVMGGIYFIKRDNDFNNIKFLENFLSYHMLFFIKEDLTLKTNLTLAISGLEIILAICWFIKRKSIKNNYLTFAIDLLLIQFMTFYNSFSFIIIFKSFKNNNLFYEDIIYKTSLFYLIFAFLLYLLKYIEKVMLKKFPVSDEIELIYIKSTKEKIEDRVYDWKNWTQNKSIKRKA
ncbi:hypothetical protein [Spiroplasma endosymbiont of Crioceris asparagi]|uniref:hypothetical protein n=1 Tax=Spiroplasma endosymbiont of Crioceris asparagi TaxID=3066286 RepID=UPI0030D154C4